MRNLEELEHRLNNDPRLRSGFFEDPVGVLRRAGVELSTRAETEVRECLLRATSAPTGRCPSGGPTPA